MRETVEANGQLLARARAGDGDAFAELTGPFRRELQAHCYRILGSAADAEDMLQETMMAAWRGLDRFEERASLRTWLHAIATNKCLNHLRAGGSKAPYTPEVPLATYRNCCDGVTATERGLLPEPTYTYPAALR